MSTNLETFCLKPGQGPDERQFSTVAVGIHTDTKKQDKTIESAAGLLASCVAASIGEGSNTQQPASAVRFVLGDNPCLVPWLIHETLLHAGLRNTPVSIMSESTSQPDATAWLRDHLEELDSHGKIGNNPTIFDALSRKNGNLSCVLEALRADVQGGEIISEAVLVVGQRVPETAGYIAQLLKTIETSVETPAGNVTQPNHLRLMVTGRGGLSLPQRHVLTTRFDPSSVVTVQFVPTDGTHWRKLVKDFEDGLAGKRQLPRTLPIE